MDTNHEYFCNTLIMKKSIFVILLFFISGFLFAQPPNLIKNHSFEDVWFYPSLVFKNDTLFSEYFHKCYYDQFRVYSCDSFCVKYWYTKIDRNIYYFSAKNTYTANYIIYKDGFKYDSVSDKKDYKLYGVPSNLNGDIPAVSGCAYLGFVPIMWSGVMNPVTGTLKYPLKKDSTYRFSFYLRNAGLMSYFFLTGLEVIFSKQIDTFSNYPSGSFLYQNVFNNTQNWIEPDLFFLLNEKCDSLYWKKYEAIYKARGGEQFFTIGVFFQDEKLIKICQNYLMKFRNEKWENSFLKTHFKNPLFIKNKCYSTVCLKNWGIKQFDLAKRAFYLIDDVSLIPCN